MKKYTLQFLIVLYIIIQVTNNWILEELTESGLKGHEILIGRSFICLFFSVSIALIRKNNIYPQKLRTQAVRLIFSGIGLLLIIQSYQYLSASSVSTLQRMDIAFIILISIVMGRYKSYDKILFVIANALTITCVIMLSDSIEEKAIGYYLALSGVFCVSISNFFVQKTALKENFYVFVNTACISCILIGVIFGLYTKISFTYSFFQISGLAFSGLCMYTLYYCLMAFYKNFTIEKAQFPAVIAAFITMITEMVIEQKWFNHLFMVSNLLLLVIITLTIRNKSLNIEKQE